MKPSEEKVFLYGMMKDITEERRALTDAYFGLKSRIDELTRLEEKGIGELSTKGFIDLLNDTETQLTIQNMNREVQHAINRRQEKDLARPRYDQIAATLERGAEDRAAATSSKHDEVARLKAKYEAEETQETELRERDRVFALEQREKELAEKEQAMIDRAIQESQQVALQLSEENDAKKSEYTPVSTDIIPKALIEEQRDKEKKIVKVQSGYKERKVSGLKTKEAIFLISKILKEAGTPVKADDIYKKLLETTGYEIEKKNFTGNVFQRVLKAEPRIERVMPGYYQFNKNNSKG